MQPVRCYDCDCSIPEGESRRFPLYVMHGRPSPERVSVCGPCGEKRRHGGTQPTYNVFGQQMKYLLLAGLAPLLIFIVGAVGFVLFLLVRTVLFGTGRG